MDINFATMGFMILSFIILYYFLNKYAFGPLMAVMEKRREMVAEQIQTAEQNRLESQQLVAEQKLAFEQARKEAYDIIEQAKQTSSRQGDDIIREARAESVRLKAEALRDIESEKNKAIAALRSQVSAMAVMIASKIVEKQVDEKTQAQLLEKYLKEVGGKL